MAEQGGIVQVEDFRGTWQVSKGWLKVVCDSHGVAPKEAKAGAAPEALAKILLREMRDDWNRTRP